MRTREIGSAREDNLVHIFENHSDPIIVDNKTLYNRLMNKVIKMLVIYGQKLQELTAFHEYHPEKIMKKASYEHFAKELDKLKSVEEGINKYMFKK